MNNYIIEKEKKLFVGGYFDRSFYVDTNNDNVDSFTDFDEGIDTYTLTEALNLGFVRSIVDWYNENTEKEWDDLTDQEKTKLIIKYTSTDELARLLYFATEEEAQEYKKMVLEEVEEKKKKFKKIGEEQDNYGYFQDVYLEVES